MKIGDKIKITKDIKALFDNSMLIKKGTIHTIESFSDLPFKNTIHIESGIKIWPYEYELIEKENHPHTKIFK